jgi:hypothetical protein
VGAEADGARVVRALADVAASTGRLIDRDVFRAAAMRVREMTGLKGKALFHPLRVALTGDDSGPELDLAVPAIERGAQLDASAGLAPVLSCLERARDVAAHLTAAGG